MSPRKTRCALGPLVLGLVATALMAVSPAQAATPPLHFAKWPSGDFGEVMIGETTVQKFFVTNTGHRATGALKVDKTGSHNFTVPRRGNHCDSRNLLPDERCRISVRYTPDLRYDQADNQYFTHASGQLTVTGHRKPPWSASKRLTGVGDTPAMRVARPVCESTLGGSLERGAPLSAWRCDWPYADQDAYDYGVGVLLTICNVSGDLSAPTSPYSGPGHTAVTECTSQGG
jgi:hypothetical protein